VSLFEGAIAMTEKEAAAVAKLAASEELIGLTRADEGESGAVQVETKSGVVYVVSAAGRVKQVSA